MFLSDKECPLYWLYRSMDRMPVSDTGDAGSSPARAGSVSNVMLFPLWPVAFEINGHLTGRFTACETMDAK